MTESLGLQVVAPPVDGLAQLRNRLDRSETSNLRWIAAGATAAVLFLAGLSHWRQPSQAPLPSWALNHPAVRLVDSKHSAVRVHNAAVVQISQSPEVSIYLIDAR